MKAEEEAHKKEIERLKEMHIEEMRRKIELKTF
jgi:hypothetical protein